MKKNHTEPIALPYDRPGLPQILLIGNGLERMDDQGNPATESLQDAGKSWDDLVKALTVPNHIELQAGDLDSVPFPLKYHLLASDKDADYPLKRNNRHDEQNKLAEAVCELGTVTNPALRRLPRLCADHIFTTNYTYSLEQVFHPGKDFLDAAVRSRTRFNYNPAFTEKGNQRLERSYRLYTGYLGKNADASQVNLWNIHGECSVKGSIILGHDGYGRLLSRIVPVCGDWRKYHDLKSGRQYAFASWPELFLFGDVYILGLGLGISEFDLWWLLRRKQREEKGTGKVYFYTSDDETKKEIRDRDLMLEAMGVIINPDGIQRESEHSVFYEKAQTDIAARIDINRRAR